MWADYWKESNMPSDNIPKPSPEISDTYAEITYAGKDPHVKVGGSYKKLTITYYNSNEVLKDQTPGEWSYWIDDVDAADLVQILESDSANSIKIKFIGTEDYLGKILTVKNTRDNVVAELQLQIVSL